MAIIPALVILIIVIGIMLVILYLLSKKRPAALGVDKSVLNSTKSKNINRNHLKVKILHANSFPVLYSSDEENNPLSSEADGQENESKSKLRKPTRHSNSTKKSKAKLVDNDDRSDSDETDYHANPASQPNTMS